MECMKASIPILKVLCDETRLRILAMLSHQDMSGCEINRSFACSQPTISYHMKLLVDAHLVHAHKEGCTAIYSINTEIWQHVHALLEVLCSVAIQEGDETHV